MALKLNEIIFQIIKIKVPPLGFELSSSQHQHTETWTDRSLVLIEDSWKNFSSFLNHLNIDYAKRIINLKHWSFYWDFFKVEMKILMNY